VAPPNEERAAGTFKKRGFSSENRPKL